MSHLFQQRTEQFKAFLDREHFRFRRRPAAAVEPGEVEISPAWVFRVGAPRTPLVDRMVEDFRRFCRECMELSFCEEREDGGREGSRCLTWRLENTVGSASDFDRHDPEVESFELTISADAIELRATHERGLLHGTHYLEWLMADRGGPFLASGKFHRHPVFMPRLSNGTFIPAGQSPEAIGSFSDEYLSLMSHYGTNGIHISLSLWELFCNHALPELNATGFDEKVAALRAFCRRTARFGIDVYLQLSTQPLMENHPVFLAHPEVRGARMEIFLEGFSGRPWHNLCSGSETVHKAYAEAFRALFGAAPELAGGILIIGGEAFCHCFTRPAHCANGDTNCPHCHGKSPSVEVARLVNTAARAIKKTGAHKKLYAWPYAAFIWASQDPAQLRWIDHLDPEVSVLCNFDCGDEDTDAGGGALFFDYNIKCIGPSTTFARQAGRLREKGRPIFAKVETNTTVDAFFLPYLPLHFRWFARVDAMKASGVAGFVGQWRFFGMNATPPEELQYKQTWHGSESAEARLATLCQRDFGLGPEESGRVIEGWRKLSDSWDLFPYSAMTCGERAAHMRGPLYLGPAHPLIFDVQDNYDLPLSFRALRGDAAELASAEEMEDLRRRAKPRYISDLLVTLPFGVKRYLELLGKCRAQWQEGMTLLRRELEGRGPRAQRELDICETLLRHLLTMENVVRFYQARDRLQNEACTVAEFNARMKTLMQILDDEIANAEAMLPILEREPLIGYGHCYGPVYDASMVREKIAQCHCVKKEELPRFSQVIRFHVWYDSP